ncbi:MAG: helical backbone metal receptor [Acidobacteriota bacterium]
MKFKEIILTLIILIFGITHIYSDRVISLSPSITEILFELGAGDKIVGNTKFCNYPPAAVPIRNIGGYLDINLEMIIELKPDIIFHYPEHFRKIKKLSQYTKLVQVSHKSINDMTDSIKIISRELGISKKGITLTGKISKQLDRVRMKVKKEQKRKIIIIIGRDPNQLRNITIIGKGDFLNEIIKISGGENAYKGEITYPSVSIESLIKMDPELIIEFSFSENPPSKEATLSLWNEFPYIKAVKNNNIHVISDDYWVRPGPRIGKIAESMYKMLHKEKQSVIIQNRDRIFQPLFPVL